MSMMDSLRRDGVVLAPPIGTLQAFNIMHYLAAKPKYNGHVKQGGIPFTKDNPVCCWDMGSVLTAPFLFEFALRFTNTAEEYLGEPALMYSVNAFATRAADGPTNPYIQEFHRDRDDRKFLALFVYLTPVTMPSNGAHEFMKGTHQREPRIETGEVETILGDEGTAFLADTFGMHRGLRPGPDAIPKYRAIAWVRWGVSDPPASYVWDKLEPVPAEALGDRYPQSKRLQESIRLVCR